MASSPVTDAAWPADEQITIALVPAVQHDLRSLQQRTKLSATDLANRAITSYQFFDAHLRAGDDVMVHDRTTGEIKFVHFQ